MKKVVYCFPRLHTLLNHSMREQNTGNTENQNNTIVPVKYCGILAVVYSGFSFRNHPAVSGVIALCL